MSIREKCIWEKRVELSFKFQANIRDCIGWFLKKVILKVRSMNFSSELACRFPTEFHFFTVLTYSQKT